MCFKTPKAQQTDPEADANAKAAEAASKANAESAYRRSKGYGSALSMGSRGVTTPANTTSALAYGKTQLGA